MTPLIRVHEKPEVGEVKIGPETQLLVSPGGTLYFYEGKWKITEIKTGGRND